MIRVLTSTKGTVSTFKTEILDIIKRKKYRSIFNFNFKSVYLHEDCNIVLIKGEYVSNQDRCRARCSDGQESTLFISPHAES